MKSIEAFFLALPALLIVFIIYIANTTDPHPSLDNNLQNKWFVQGQAKVDKRLQTVGRGQSTQAKNIILFVGDGMGVSTVTAARIFAGQQLVGHVGGEEYSLSFETFPQLALAKTYNTNQQVPDSAGTMTAMMSGVKTRAGVIGIREQPNLADCAGSIGNEVANFLELAELAGVATGIVTTARLTHATPAATYAHTPQRNWENDSKLPKKNACKDIAAQFVEFPYGDGIEVAFGGGRANFLPKTVTVEGKQGLRSDGRDLTKEWKEKYGRYARYVTSHQEFDALDTELASHVLGLFDASHMHYEHDRQLGKDKLGEPSLGEMTAKALDVLEHHQQGYFLMVESGRIDHGHHDGNAHRALSETVEFADAVQVAMDRVDIEDTLIIVTADHSHVFTMGGYPTRGNPILGTVVKNDATGNPKLKPDLAKDKKPYTTLGYANGVGYQTARSKATADEAAKQHRILHRRHLHPHVNTQHAEFHQESLVPLSSETHSGEDVAVYAIGPGSQAVNGVMEQSEIFHVMERASNMLERVP